MMETWGQVQFDNEARVDVVAENVYVRVAVVAWDPDDPKKDIDAYVQINISSEGVIIDVVDEEAGTVIGTSSEDWIELMDRLLSRP